MAKTPINVTQAVFSNPEGQPVCVKQRIKRGEAVLACLKAWALMRNGSKDTQQAPLLCLVRSRRAGTAGLWRSMFSGSVCLQECMLPQDRFHSTFRLHLWQIGPYQYQSSNTIVGFIQLHKTIFFFLRGSKCTRSRFELNQFRFETLSEDISHDALKISSTQPSSCASTGVSVDNVLPTTTDKRVSTAIDSQ